MKVIWKMFTENGCNTFTDLNSKRADLLKEVMDMVAQDVS